MKTLRSGENLGQISRKMDYTIETVDFAQKNLFGGLDSARPLEKLWP
jgi:hypothetical protein